MSSEAPSLDRPGFDLYANQQGRIIGSLTAILIITTLSVALRLLSRKLARAGFWVRNGVQSAYVVDGSASSLTTLVERSGMITLQSSLG